MVGAFLKDNCGLAMKWVISRNNQRKLKREGKSDNFKELWDGSENDETT